MRKIFCLLNHILSERQVQELIGTYGDSSIEYPPDSIKNLWSNLPVDHKLSKQTASVIFEWLNQNSTGKNDIIILQGEAGYSFAIVDYALTHKFIPIHAVTKRVVQEVCNGEKIQRTYIFEHICFRKYKYYNDL